MIISHSILHVRVLPEKVVEKIKPYLICSVTFFKSRSMYEIMWKNIVEADVLQVTIWNMRIACWNHTLKYIIIIAFKCMNDLTNAPLCCVICTLPVLFFLFMLPL
jgi:hypothetical protein